MTQNQSNKERKTVKSTCDNNNAINDVDDRDN